MKSLLLVNVSAEMLYPAEAERVFSVAVSFASRLLR
jgi:hypothetical protein